MAENRTDSVILAGFSDSRGEYQENLNRSCKRAEVIKEELVSRGITVLDLLCVGEEMPVASNKSEQGREKNRRVEVWMK